MSLISIKKRIVNDPENAWAKKKGWKPVYTAHKDARILIIGQAPGIRAQESHIPWNDPSGDNLRAWMGINKDLFYDEKKIALVPMDFYFPGYRGGKKSGGDLPPRKEFAEKWHPLLLEEMSHISLTILIGQYAHAHYLRDTKKKTLTETVKNFKEYSPRLFPLVHPSPRNNIWQAKNPWFKKSVLPTLKRRVTKALR